MENKKQTKNLIQKPIVLNEAYYLDNFTSLINFVYERHNDLLKREEINFIFDFKKLPINAQRLYVRLISRKGPFFRKDKIKYSEIPDLEDCLNELCNRNFFIRNPRNEPEFLLNTITKPELDAFIIKYKFTLSPIENKLVNRIQIEEYLLKQEHTFLCELLEKEYTFYYPCFYEVIVLMKVLFFGNTHQDLSEFILEDIGVLKFEPYEIRKQDRLFNDRKIVDDFIFISQVRTELWFSIQNNDLESVISIGESIKSYNFDKKVKRKFEKSFAEIGRFLEKYKLWDKALEYYNLCSTAPENERKIRVLEKKERYVEALNELEIIIKESLNEEEIEFARTFSEIIKKKLGLKYQKRIPENFKTENIVAEKNENLRVEEIALNYYIEKNMDGFYSENGIWKALFGLTFWDIIFMPVPEVFFNPFHRGPTDLFTTDFREKRKDAIVKRLSEINKNSFPETILNTYDLKYNTANWLISWNRVSKDQIRTALEIIPKNALIQIFDKMSRNLKDLKTGFPDLLIFESDKKSYCLVEVKGPGDQLRPNQKRWLRFFSQHSIPFKVASISWI